MGFRIPGVGELERFIGVYRESRVVQRTLVSEISLPLEMQ